MAINKKTFRITVGVILTACLLTFTVASVSGLSFQPQQTLETEKIPKKIGFIGDSITIATRVEKSRTAVSREMLLLGSDYTAVNKGVDGSTSADWLPGGDLFKSALSEFQSQNVTIVSVMLGTNDSKDALRTTDLEYRLHLQTIIDAFLDSGTITKVILNYPPYMYPQESSPWNSDSVARLASYTKQIDSLINDTTILKGDTTSYSYFKAHPEELEDGVHPNENGYASLGSFWAVSYMRIFAEKHETPAPQAPRQILQL